MQGPEKLGMLECDICHSLERRSVPGAVVKYSSLKPDQPPHFICYDCAIKKMRLDEPSVWANLYGQSQEDAEMIRKYRNLYYALDDQKPSNTFVDFSLACIRDSWHAPIYESWEHVQPDYAATGRPYFIKRDKTGYIDLIRYKDDIILTIKYLNYDINPFFAGANPPNVETVYDLVYPNYRHTKKLCKLCRDGDAELYSYCKGCVCRLLPDWYQDNDHPQPLEIIINCTPSYHNGAWPKENPALKEKSDES